MMKLLLWRVLESHLFSDCPNLVHGICISIKLSYVGSRYLCSWVETNASTYSLFPEH